MPLKIIQSDIVHVKADAIVNSTNQFMVGVSGADFAIHQGAGPYLDNVCEILGTLKPGEINITPGFRLNCKYVFHTSAPSYHETNAPNLLKECYQKSLRQAAAMGLDSIAFPILGAGYHKFPKGLALRIAVDSIREFILENDLLVYLVILSFEEFEPEGDIFKGLEKYLTTTDTEKPSNHIPSLIHQQSKTLSASRILEWKESDVLLSPHFHDTESDLDDLLEAKEPTFQQMLLGIMDEKGIPPAKCYKKANIDRKLFSKIQCNVDYNPSKNTVMAFAVALELSLDETEELLMKAGFAFSDANKKDRVIRYFIMNRHYDIVDINQALFKYGLSLLD